MRRDDPREAMLEAVLANDVEAQQDLLVAQLGITSPTMANDDLVDAKIAASEARTDVKLERFSSKLDRVLSELSGLKEDVRSVRDDNRHTRSTVRNSAFALAGLILALLALLATIIPATVQWGQQHPAVQATSQQIVNEADTPAKLGVPLKK